MNKLQDLIRKDCNVDKISNVSLVAFFTSNEQQVKTENMRSQILPVFIEEATTSSIMKHCLTIILKVHECTFSGEVPWVTADQPVLALLKII